MICKQKEQRNLSHCDMVYSSIISKSSCFASFLMFASVPPFYDGTIDLWSFFLRIDQGQMWNCNKFSSFVYPTLWCWHRCGTARLMLRVNVFRSSWWSKVWCTLQRWGEGWGLCHWENVLASVFILMRQGRTRLTAVLLPIRTSIVIFNETLQSHEY